MCGGNHCPKQQLIRFDVENHEKIAYETGSEVAKSGSVLITGGLEGVMKAASHGAKDAGDESF